MANYLSGVVPNLRVVITSHSEALTSLTVIENIIMIAMASYMIIQFI